jgi:MFS transporter, Spinster family, sphingosine-1-phosphate transporter
MRDTIYRRYLLVILLSILAFNYQDRLALGLVMQDIKTDMHLSDTQLGLLSGIAFALFYSVMGVPIGRWADRGDRALIVSLTTALWSAAVILSGLAASFLQLLLVRICVAVGEAGCMPVAQSLISSYFNRAERPRATAVYMLGGPISVVIGYFIGGWLSELYGWRVMFMMLGPPGLLLAALAWLTLKEPRREEPKARADQPSIVEVCAVLTRSATFRHLLLAISVMYFFSYGIGQWKAAFFIRSFGLKTGELGTWFAVIYGVGGLLGTWLGGAWASRYAPDDESRQLQVMAGAYSVFAAVSAAVYVSPDYHMAFAFIALAAVGGGIALGPLFACLQAVVPERMRATSIALVYLVANLLGMGLGPLAAGMLSDALQQWAGQESLRYALLVLCPGYCWAGWHLWRASKTVARDLAAAP